MLLDYIRRHMEHVEELELWHSWMGGGGEEEYPPLVKTREISLGELTVDEIENFCRTDVFQTYFDNVDIGKQNRLLIKKIKAQRSKEQ